MMHRKAWLGRSCVLAIALLAAANQAPAAFLSIATDFAVDQGGTITIPVNLVTETSGVTFQAADIALAFDATRFTVSNVRAGSLTGAGSGFSGAFNTSVSGQINSTQSGPNALTVSANTIASLLLFDLTAGPAAQVGSSSLNILAQGSPTVTALNEGLVALSPAPTNGATDARVDGLINVRVVPEPGSTVLLGIGGLLGLLIGKRLGKSRRG